jgi:thioredoxin 1
VVGAVPKATLTTILEKHFDTPAEA